MLYFWMALTCSLSNRSVILPRQLGAHTNEDSFYQVSLACVGQQFRHPESLLQFNLQLGLRDATSMAAKTHWHS